LTCSNLFLVMDLHRKLKNSDYHRPVIELNGIEIGHH
jgi:hypothetical protein